MGKMAEIDYENQQTDKDGTEGVVDLEKEMKPKKKKSTKTKVDPFDERLKDIENDLKMAGKTVDELNQSINAISDLLNRVADRMGMK